MQTHHEHVERYEWVYTAGLVFSAVLVALGFVLDSPQEIWNGLIRIITTQDLLITDYFYVAGPGAALVNAGIVNAIAMNVIRFSGDPCNGFTIVEIGLMTGFALFGKNFVNIWPIILGTWLYSKYQKEPFSKYSSVALLATALSPMVSYMALGSTFASLPLGFLVGVGIGFAMPTLSAYTYKIQNGMNLYNMGFACGLFALMVVPILTALGDKPETVLYWAEDYNLLFGCIMAAFCLILIAIGFFSKHPVWAVWAGYRRLISTTGRAPSDYLRMFGGCPVLVNMGINGLIATGYILITGGDLNGPTIGAILTVMGFSAVGKHALNIVPVMVGIGLSAALIHGDIAKPALQIAALFGTALAPVAGHFGWLYGIIAGFIHASLVMQTGGPVGGLNLYNNGFSAGLIVTVMYPTVTAIVRRRRITVRDEDYYDLFEEDAPIDISSWRTHGQDNPHVVEERERLHHHAHHAADILPETEDGNQETVEDNASVDLPDDKTDNKLDLD